MGFSLEIEGLGIYLCTWMPYCGYLLRGKEFMVFVAGKGTMKYLLTKVSPTTSFLFSSATNHSFFTMSNPNS